MGRKSTWLAAMQPAIRALLLEIESRSPYDNSALFLARVARVLAAPGEEPRSPAAMRQAWWRWAQAGAGQASLPPVDELAALVRFASAQGWLRDVTDPSVRALIERLREHGDNRRAQGKRALERSLQPQVRTALADMFAHLEAELARTPLDQGEGVLGVHLTVASYDPPPLVVQEFVDVVTRAFMAQLLKDLAAPRDFYDTTDLSDAQLRHESLMRPHSGWPSALRQIAASVYALLEQRALELEGEERRLDEEQRTLAAQDLQERIDRGETGAASATARRRRLFKAGSMPPQDEEPTDGGADSNDSAH